MEEKPLSEEHSDLYIPLHTFRMIKSRKMNWFDYVARMAQRKGVHRILVGKPEGNRTLGRSRFK